MTDLKHNNGKEELLATVVFCDYEYWFWSLYNQYGEKPDVSKTIHEIKKHGKLIDVYFYGDFTSDLMQKEREKLRRIANNIIDCASNNKKEYTDFILRRQKTPSSKQLRRWVMNAAVFVLIMHNEHQFGII